MLGAKGSLPLTAFNTLAAQRCELNRQGISSSVCEAVMGATQASAAKVYWTMLKRMRRLCAQEGVPNSVISVPKLADILFHLCRVGLGLPTD